MRALAIFVSLLFVLVVPLSLTDCTSNTAPTGGVTSDPAVTANALADTMPHPDYQISPRDILEVTVFQVPDLSRTVQVGDDGSVTLPLIGRTKVAGETTNQAEQAIADRLRKKYLQSPQVTVLVKQYGQRVTVSGEVKSPRVLSVDGKLTLSQAVASAGGLSDLANGDRIHVARSSNGHIQDEVYNLNQILVGKAADPTLRGGDLVVAEQSGVQVALKNMKDILPFAVLASII
jgi:polysaccharide export outer membrane protein